MPYAILRFKKVKIGGVSAACKHNERQKEIYKSNPDIDINRSVHNYHFVEPQQTYHKEVKRMIAAAGCKSRSNSTVMVETLITASPEFMNDLPKKEQQEFFSRAFDFMAEKIGKENIIAATVHMDETTPHMHLSFCPITADKRLSAKDILGNQKKLSNWQTVFHECMSARWNVLERGISSMETKRKHISVWLFKTATRLDKQFDEVTAAVADINVLNAGKKRDNALDLLEKWMPQAEKFTAQIKTVEGYIRTLEQDKQCNISVKRDLADCNNDLKKKLSDKEYEIYRAGKKIYDLQCQIEKQKRLLDKLPPEIRQQLNRKERER